MEFMLSWKGFGVIAFALALINLIRVSGGHTAGSQAFIFGSLSGGLLAMLDEYRRADAMVRAEDFTGLTDWVSWSCTMLMVACFLLIILNLLSAAISMGVNVGKRRRDRKALAEAQRQAAEAAQRAEAAEQKLSEAVEAPPAEEWKRLAEENVQVEKDKEETAEDMTVENKQG